MKTIPTILRRKRLFYPACVGLILLVGLGCWFYVCLPEPLFDAPFSTVLLDRDGKLLSASIAEDGQWRFPPIEHLPDKVVQAMLCYEDKRFFSHPGVDPFAVTRALWQNIRSRKVISGASTITMQVIRLSRHGQPRTLCEKLIEMILALRLELSKNKQEILSLYTAYAPFGGNVVGIEAAAWRYFGREPDKLSWAESAMLAVLPNSPALIHPGRNRDQLLKKRNELLDKLQQEGNIDTLSCQLAKQEPLPPQPYPLPMLAPHLLARIKNSRQQEYKAAFAQGRQDACVPNARIRTTLQKDLQVRASEILQRHVRTLAGNEVHNAAALVLDVNSGHVIAYIGNVFDMDQAEHGNHVDIITAPRNTGSILKPLLYAGMLNAGELLPSQLIPDIPTRLGSFAPQNYSRTYEGAVPAYMALARSLNIPAVYILRAYSVDRFSALLRQLGMTTLSRPAYEYGLSLILGGAEGTLWDITSIYASMARRLNNYFTSNPEQPAFFPPRYVAAMNSSPAPHNPLEAAACWLTFQAMLEVVRPAEEMGWQQFSSARKVAWKTGTSYGFRDAWAIGVTPQYAVGVWVGNADGEGRPGLTGITTAAPILFELFGLLDRQGWFQRPEADLIQIPVCAQSGYRAGPSCAQTKQVWVTRAGLRSKPCPYCQVIHYDVTRQWRVHSDCERIAAMTPEKWFVLPPAMEWYYKTKHSNYRPLPPYRSDCLEPMAEAATNSMTLIYPVANSQIYVPLELDGKRGKTVFEVAHRDAHTMIYWHLDNEYLGETQDIHQFALDPEPGNHILTLVDEHGERLQRKFTVLVK